MNIAQYYTQYETTKEALTAELARIQSSLKALEQEKEEKISEVLKDQNSVEVDGLLIQRQSIARRSVNIEKLRKSLQGSELNYSDFIVETPKTIAELDKIMKREGVVLDIYDINDSGYKLKITKI